MIPIPLIPSSMTLLNHMVLEEAVEVLRQDELDNSSSI
jgi:hypothetical protein